MKRIVTILYKPGGTGPQGPQGPPGTADLPITASDVIFEGDGRTVEQVLADLTFVDLVIQSFTTPQTIFEIGQVITSLVFNWVLNKTITSQTITGTQVTPPTLLPADRSKSVVFTNLSSNGTVTLTANDGVGPAVTKSVSISFLKSFLYGVAPQGTVNSAFLNTLTKSLQSARQKTVTLNLTSGQYGWIAYPVTYGSGTFKLNGFSGGMNSPLTVSYTNSYGYTENYYVFRSENANLGVTEFQAL